MTDIPQHPRLVERTPDELRAFMAQSHLVHFIGLALRPDIAACIQRIEFAHFPPTTKKNEDFHVNIFDWAEVAWILISVPSTEQKLVERAVRESGLTLAWGAPKVSVNSVPQKFPFPSLRLYMLTGSPDPTGFPIMKQ